MADARRVGQVRVGEGHAPVLVTPQPCTDAVALHERGELGDERRWIGDVQQPVVVGRHELVMGEQNCRRLAVAKPRLGDGALRCLEKSRLAHEERVIVPGAVQADDLYRR